MIRIALSLAILAIILAIAMPLILAALHNCP